MRVEISNKHRTGRPREAGGVKAHVDVYSQDFLTRTNLTSSLAATVWGAIGGNHESVI